VKISLINTYSLSSAKNVYLQTSQV